MRKLFKYQKCNFILGQCLSYLQEKNQPTGDANPGPYSTSCRMFDFYLFIFYFVWLMESQN